MYLTLVTVFYAAGEMVPAITVVGRSGLTLVLSQRPFHHVG